MEYQACNRDRISHMTNPFMTSPDLELDRRSSRGFTIVELMIVVSVIGILAGIMIPSFVQSRSVANEGAVVGTLRAIASGEFNFKTMGLVDVDNNGGYEFATLREMTGGQVLRGSNGERLSPNLLPLSLDRVDENGRFLRHGYYFQLYLPDATGAGISETAANIPMIDPGFAAEYWTVLAWPAQRGTTGKSTYFINQQGEIVKATIANYSGLDRIPAPGAALLNTMNPDRIDSTEIAVRENGADGELWVPVK